MDIKQDPNSIPNFGGGGRVGELSANEPEQAQSSVELDQEDGGDTPVGSGKDSPLDNGSSATATPTLQPGQQGQAQSQSQSQSRAAQPPTMAEAGGLPVDPSKTGEGSIDALVGAP